MRRIRLAARSAIAAIKQAKVLCLASVPIGRCDHLTREVTLRWLNLQMEKRRDLPQVP